MPMEKLTKKQLAEASTSAATGYAPYVKVMQDMRVGEGGRVDMSKEKVGRQTVKNRVKKSAEACHLEVKFRRSPSDLVIFEVTGRTK